MQDGNFYSSFEEGVRRDGSAVVFELEDGKTITRTWLHALSGRYANALRAVGCEPGDRVAVQLDKSAHAFALYLACVRAGLCYLPVNTAYKCGELMYLLEDAEPKAFFKYGEAGVLHATTRTFSFGADGDGTFADSAAAASEEFATVDVREGDPAALLYTSGTTGRPKGAVLSHRALTYSARTLSDIWGFSSSDVLLHTLPIFHSHGLFIAFNVALASGARVLLQSKFDVESVLAALPRSTVFMGVPTYYHRLLAHPCLSNDVCRSMRLFVSGSAPLSADVHREFEGRTGQRILERYGSTEAMIICSNPLAGERRPGSVGFPIPGVELRIADQADRPLPGGSIGMIQARGPGFFSEYWKKPAQTSAEFTEDGFFRSGDLGRLDQDGYVTITGRAKDLIISGGYNVYPAEVEAVIDEMPSVREAAVVGGPHPDFGECVVAFVIPVDRSRPPVPADVIQTVKSRLANYKVPKQVVVVDDLPRNMMGKVLKNQLRASLIAVTVDNGLPSSGAQTS
ncbi:AMP-binding protein [Bradyrhizobium sp. WSM3983]|uniref:AMP-binding protein n=1 Tax=Bradyrhizobium sp. WSM3983 TaxID=1038867 RepID=UPI0004094C31|nr:AMP-binding protein [Bradyrhizobium sp. WSM3983]